MSRELAHQILDEAKAGVAVTEAAIKMALMATGDLGHRPPWMPLNPPHEDEE